MAYTPKTKLIDKQKKIFFLPISLHEKYIKQNEFEKSLKITSSMPKKITYLVEIWIQQKDAQLIFFVIFWLRFVFIVENTKNIKREIIKNKKKY